MAGNKRPSFLKRQKEQKRQARAVEKREARRARKHARSEAAAAGDLVEAPGEEFESDEVVEEVNGEPDDERES